MKSKKIVLTILGVFIFIGIWNFPLKYRVGAAGVLYEKSIPFYAKACGYFYRDWMYKDIARGIVAGKKDDTDRALAILDWVSSNIKLSVPPGFKTMDDHPLNIIIRQYGEPDQLNDIFMILCSYAGMKGGMCGLYNKRKDHLIMLSFIEIKGRRLIFDASRNKYFLNRKGEIASAEDYLKGELVLSGKERESYGEYLEGLRRIDLRSFTRADEQMPLRRIPATIKRAFKKGSSMSAEATY